MPLDSEQRKQLALLLKEKNELTVTSIAHLLGVTRQAVYLYFKPDSEHG
jgi:predicted transcriptional regulator